MASRSIKTEAIVLRGIRYGEADRILHLYSPDHGRLGAIAKGVRKPRSRFGGRLEPFFRVSLILYRGRGDLATVSAAETIDGYGRLRSTVAGLGAASAACDAVLRLFDTVDPSPAAYNLLCRYLELLDAAPPGEADPAAPGGARPLAVAFRLKLALAAGFAPELAACARCGAQGEVSGFSGAAGGIVCAACQAGAIPLGAEGHAFMVESLGAPLASAPAASEIALRQAERSVLDVLDHHAHTRLRPVA